MNVNLKISLLKTIDFFSFMVKWVNITFKMVAVSECSYTAWTRSLRNLANASAITTANHPIGCGKREIGQKGYEVFTENYVHNVFVKKATDEEGHQFNSI